MKRSRKWLVYRRGYIVRKFERLEQAQSFIQSEGWSEDGEVSIVQSER